MGGLRIVVTYNCNIMCSHCKYKCGPFRKGMMDTGTFRNRVIQGYEEGYSDYMIIEGGEPLLHAGAVYKYLKKIKNLEMKKYIVTNGFWGNIEQYLFILEDFKRIGLHGIIIEYDYFHSIFINLPTVKNAIAKSLISGISVSIRASFVTNDIRTDADKKTFEYIKEIRNDFKNISFIFDEACNNDLAPRVKGKINDKERIILYREY